MQASEKIIEFIKKFEGFSNKVYLCPAGKPTIGYGHVVESEIFNAPITTQDGDRMLKLDLEKRSKWLNTNLPADIGQNKFDALLSLVFNSTNDGNLERVAPKAFALIKKCKYDEAAIELFSKEKGLVFITVKDRRTGERTKQVSEGLANRRQGEWNIWNGK